MSTTYLMLARIPEQDRAAFDEYEERVLPLIATHGGRLERRLRSEDGATEAHLVTFQSAGDFERYRDDPRRVAHGAILEGTGVESVLHELHDVVPAAALPGGGALPPEGPSQSGLSLRPLAPGDEPELLRIIATPEVARWWDAPPPRFPWEAPECTRLTVEVHGRVAGLAQYWEEEDPQYRHAEVDIALDPALHGRGLGSEAVRLVVSHLLGVRGHHRVTIDPAAANLVAIRCYEKAGFSRVGIMRRAERDVDGRGWHDTLLMEILASDLAS